MNLSQVCKTILLIDPSGDVTVPICSILSKEGTFIQEANSFDEVQDCLSQLHFDAILFNIKLKDCDTSQKCLQLLTSDQYMSMPLFFLGDGFHEGFSEKVKEKWGNVKDCFNKPVKENVLLERLMKYFLDERVKEQKKKDLDIEFDVDLSKLKINFKDTESINQRDQNGATPLMKGCLKGEFEFVDGLLYNEAKISIKCNLGRNALHYAAMGGSDKIITLLISLGIDVNLRDNEKFEPLFYAVKYARKNAAIALMHKGARISTRFENGRSYLFLTVENNDVSIFKALLDHGLDPFIRDYKNRDVSQLIREKNLAIFYKYLNANEKKVKK